MRITMSTTTIFVHSKLPYTIINGRIHCEMSSLKLESSCVQTTAKVLDAGPSMDMSRMDFISTRPALQSLAQLQSKLDMHGTDSMPQIANSLRILNITFLISNAQ